MFCQIGRIDHALRMKSILWIPVFCAFALTFSSCGNLNSDGGKIGSNPLGTGPFDENGNYVEAWADNPAKWRRSGSAPSPHELRSDEIPLIAKSEQPPQGSIPLASASKSSRKISISKTSAKAKVKSGAKKTTRISSKPKSSSASTKSKAKSKTKSKIKAASEPMSTKTKAKSKASSKKAAEPKSKPKSTKRVPKKDG